MKNTMTKNLLLILLVLVVIAGTACVKNRSQTKVSPLKGALTAMVFDEDARELLIQTDSGVSRYSEEGLLISGARVENKERFEKLKQKGKTQIESDIHDLTLTPVGMISYQTSTRELSIGHAHSYRRSLVRNIDRPAQVLYVEKVGRLYLAFPQAGRLMSLALRGHF